MFKFSAGILVGVTLATGIPIAYAAVYAKANTNGIMKGYIVQDRRGREVCRDPFVQIEFRGPESYINCQ